MRGLLRTLAAEGRTVFLSSHLMSEMALTADHLVIIGTICVECQGASVTPAYQIVTGDPDTTARDA